MVGTPILDEEYGRATALAGSLQRQIPRMKAHDVRRLYVFQLACPLDEHRFGSARTPTNWKDAVMGAVTQDSI